MSRARSGRLAGAGKPPEPRSRGCWLSSKLMHHQASGARTRSPPTNAVARPGCGSQRRNETGERSQGLLEAIKGIGSIRHSSASAFVSVGSARKVSWLAGRRNAPPPGGGPQCVSRAPVGRFQQRTRWRKNGAGALDCRPETGEKGRKPSFRRPVGSHSILSGRAPEPCYLRPHTCFPSSRPA